MQGPRASMQRPARGLASAGAPGARCSACARRAQVARAAPPTRPQHTRACRTPAPRLHRLRGPWALPRRGRPACWRTAHPARPLARRLPRAAVSAGTAAHTPDQHLPHPTPAAARRLAPAVSSRARPLRVRAQAPVDQQEKPASPVPTAPEVSMHAHMPAHAPHLSLCMGPATSRMGPGWQLYRPCMSVHGPQQRSAMEHGPRNARAWALVGSARALINRAWALQHSAWALIRSCVGLACAWCCPCSAWCCPQCSALLCNPPLTHTYIYTHTHIHTHARFTGRARVCAAAMAQKA